jgi:hypothetical protein
VCEQLNLQHAHQQRQQQGLLFRKQQYQKQEVVWEKSSRCVLKQWHSRLLRGLRQGWCIQSSLLGM